MLEYVLTFSIWFIHQYLILINKTVGFTSNLCRQHPMEKGIRYNTEGSPDEMSSYFTIIYFCQKRISFI